MRFLLAVLLATIPACSLLKRTEETLVKTNDRLDQAQQEADTNQDGSVSTYEQWLYLLGLGGAAAAAYMAKRSSDKGDVVVNARVNKTKSEQDAQWEELSKLKETVSVLTGKPVSQ